MEISTISGSILVSSSGVVDNTPYFENNVNTANRTFAQGEVLQDENKLYERTGSDFLATDYDAQEEQNYVLNQVLYKNDMLHFVSALDGNDVIKQVEEYTVSPPENLVFGSWNHRYLKLGTLDLSTNMWSKETNGVTHSLRSNGVNWLYRTVRPYKHWSEQKYILPITYARWSDQPDGMTLFIQWEGVIVYKELRSVRPGGEIFVGYDGNRYLMPHYREILGDSYYYGVSIELDAEAIYETIVQTLAESHSAVNELKAVCSDQSNCANEWLAKTIIRRGNDLYARTNTDDAIETRVVNNVEYAPLERLDQANGWGWTYIAPTNIYAPLDNKKYTFVSAASPVEYTLNCIALVDENGDEKSNNVFDTVAINGLVATSVEVTFLPDDGSEPIPTITMYPKTNRDVNNILSATPTTLIVYAPRSITGNVNIKFISDGKVRVGGIFLGQSVNAGFTNLQFKNRFNNYGLKEKDSYGNILYVDGAKTNIHSGTVDIPITTYDMMHRLWTSIGGNTIILNGSDSKDNSEADSQSVFSSTMLIGRVEEYELGTNIVNKEIGDMATYPFRIEEDV